MSCGPSAQNFRLLDGFVGWDREDPKDCAGLTGFGFDDAEGLRLAQEQPTGPKDCAAPQNFVPVGEVLAYLPPSRLARGCGRCDWFLAAETQLRRHDCCGPTWSSVWSVRCDQHLLRAAVAVAARGNRVAVADEGAKRIWIWERDGERLIGSVDSEHLTQDRLCDASQFGNRITCLGPLAFAPWGELLAADVGTNSIWRFGPTGAVRGKLNIALPTEVGQSKIRNLAVSNNCSVWVVTARDDSSLELWQARLGDSKFKHASIAELQRAFEPTGLTAANDDGFCIEQCGAEGLPVAQCFGWNGEPLEQPIAPPAKPQLYRQGQLLTRAIDCGVPRCRWHRVRVDADVPSGTSLEIAVATGEPPAKGAPATQGDPALETGWETFSAGVPHHSDWQVAPAGSLDFLVDQPPGRVLYVRLRLKGNGQVSPVVRRVRLDFPRVTSLELLPPVYRDNPSAEDFTERFLSLFDASLADLDRAIERAPALLDPAGVPADVLPWLGSFLDLAFDPAWKVDLRREVLAALPDLYRRRGTISGLTDTIKLIFGVTPAIQELATERAWGSVAKPGAGKSLNAAQLGMVRLFGKSRARFRLNTSALGKAPLRSYGNPDHDPLLAQAFRLRVLIPPLVVNTAAARQSLEQLVVSQKPAHTVASIRFGGDGFLLGDKSAIGVDTIFGSLPPPVLGTSGNIRLRRMSVLRRGVHGVTSGIRTGETSIVGVKTIAA